MTTSTFTTIAGRSAHAGADGEMLITTATPDRVNDELDPTGADVAAYLSNPIVKYGHGTEQLPVAVTTHLRVEAGRGISAAFRWLTGDAFADRVRNAYDQGALRAASIEFRPLQSEPRPGGRGRRFTKWELLAWAFVPVPCNAEAVATLKSLGLWRASEPIVFTLTDSPITRKVRNLPPGEKIRFVDNAPARYTVDRHALADGLRSGLQASLTSASFRHTLRQTVDAKVHQAFNGLLGRID